MNTSEILSGMCIWYNERGYGLIQCENGNDYFVHRSELNNINKLQKHSKYFFTPGNDNVKKRLIAKHVHTKSIKEPNKKKNTTDFTPRYDDPDMKLKVIVYKENTHFDNYEIQDINTKSVLVVPNFVEDICFDEISRELDLSGANFKMWHGDSHWIADDRSNDWKGGCPLFHKIVNRIREYFKLEVKATRLNWYENNSDWKPYHHDAAAIDEEKAKTQNITIGVSLGSVRDICFQHAKNMTTISIPMLTGSAYAFGKDININWKHGIPPKSIDINNVNNSRISIIVWGYSTYFE